MAKKLEHDNGTVRDASDGDGSGSKTPDNVSGDSDDE